MVRKTKKDEVKFNDTTDVHPTPFSDEQVLQFPQMSYTAVMTSREMAGSFVRYLLTAASKMVPRQWTAQDLQDLLSFVIEGGDSPIQFIEGRYLRRKIQDQIIRAERYKEPFSLMVIKFNRALDEDVYSSLIDLLTERLRRSDMVTLYRQKVAIILPHTPGSVLDKLIERIHKLARATDSLKEVKLHITTSSYPSDSFATPYEILDWIEDELR